MLYDIEMLFEDLDMTNEERENLIRELKEEFPQDEMLFELHLYRAIKFLKKQKE